MSDERQGRVQTASDPAKAFRQYDELRRTKRLKRALIVAELEGGNFRVLGQMANPAEMARLCMVAAEALAQVPEAQRGVPIAEKATEAQPGPRTPVRTDSKRLLTLAASWASLEAETFNAETSPLQRREMRRAFYAGALGFFEILISDLDPGDEPTDKDMNKVDNLQAELVRFAEALDRGEA